MRDCIVLIRFEVIIFVAMICKSSFLSTQMYVTVDNVMRRKNVTQMQEPANVSLDCALMKTLTLNASVSYEHTLPI